MSKVMTGTLGTRLHNLPGKYGLYYFELTVHFPKFFEIQGVKRLENRRSIISVIKYVCTGTYALQNRTERGWKNIFREISGDRGA